jgi:hypothetical protein
MTLPVPRSRYGHRRLPVLEDNACVAVDSSTTLSAHTLAYGD